jgi:hypothetical protein
VRHLAKHHAPAQRLLTRVIGRWYRLIGQKQQQMSTNLLIAFEQPLSLDRFVIEIQNFPQRPSQSPTILLNRRVSEGVVAVAGQWL